jgi:hypothetical protein
LKPGQIHHFAQDFLRGKHQKQHEHQLGPQTGTGRNDRRPTARGHDGPQSAQLLSASGQSTVYTSNMRYLTLVLTIAASLPKALSFAETSPVVAWSSHRYNNSNKSITPSQVSLTLCVNLIFSGVVPLTDYDLVPSPPVQRRRS